jgi:glycosyltransferase involved in cell wall biosynthesis
MITILHIITDLDRGGAETVLYRFLIKTTTDVQQRHVVVSMRDRGFFGDKFEAAGILVHTLNMKRGVDLPSAFIKLVSLMRRIRPDVVQTWLYHADLLGGLAAQFCGRPPVLWGVHTVHLAPGSSSLTKVIRRLCALTSNWLPSIIVCVAHAAIESHVALGYHRGRMQVVHNGFDLPDTQVPLTESRKLRSSLGFQDHHQVIGCIGRFHLDKDYSTFLRAASMLKERQPEVRFLLVGRELSASNEMLQSWILEASLQDHVVALGERSDITTCLLAMDVFCLPSQTEAFPLVLGEAMAASRPVVTTDVGDAALLVGDAGFVVPIRDPVRLCNALQQMLRSSTTERLAIGNAARGRIEREFSLQAMVDRLLSLYSVVIAQRALHSSN